MIQKEDTKFTTMFTIRKAGLTLQTTHGRGGSKEE
jgi:hypothetical protein